MNELAAIRVEEGGVIVRTPEGLHARGMGEKTLCGVALSEVESTDGQGLIDAWMEDKYDEFVCFKCIELRMVYGDRFITGLF